MGSFRATAVVRFAPQFSEVVIKLTWLNKMWPILTAISFFVRWQSHTEWSTFKIFVTFPRLPWPSTLYPNFWRYIRSKLRFTKEEAEDQNIALYPNFRRYIRTTLRLTKEDVEFHKNVLTLYSKKIAFYLKKRSNSLRLIKFELISDASI